MKYLKFVKDKALVFRGGFPLKLQIFTDASHAGDPDNRRSVTGVVIKLAGNTVYWCSLYQTIVSHSSFESELMALDKGATIGQCARWIAEVMGVVFTDPSAVFVDNQSTITVTENKVQPNRNLHIHARFFYAQDLVVAGEYILYHIPSADQVADILCTYKGPANFVRLYALLTGCALVEMLEGKPVWNMALLE